MSWGGPVDVEEEGGVEAEEEDEEVLNDELEMTLVVGLAVDELLVVVAGPEGDAGAAPLSTAFVNRCSLQPSVRPAAASEAVSVERECRKVMSGVFLAAIL